VNKRTRERAREMFETKKKKIRISVEGNIGSGKSTLVRNLSEHTQLNGYVQKVDALKTEINNFYIDPKKNCFDLQNKFQLQYKESWDFANIRRGDFCIEGILSTFFVFTRVNYDLANLTDTEFTQLDFSYQDRNLPMAFDFDVIFYLYSTDLNINLQRIKDREQLKEEQKITIEYLKTIEDQYESYLKPKSNVIRINNTHLSAEETLKIVMENLKERIN